MAPYWLCRGVKPIVFVGRMNGRLCLRQPDNQKVPTNPLLPKIVDSRGSFFNQGVATDVTDVSYLA